MKTEKSQEQGPRIRREKKTIKALVELYCRDKHNSQESLCSGCAGFLEYALTRLDNCPFQEDKTTCAKCPIHCYEPEMREMAKKIMGYSGPKLIWRHPILAIKHLLDRRKKPPEIPSQKT
ncbi:MAG: nitrous oxide-stimulated promoter family protein [Thermoproteota archaeon]